VCPTNTPRFADHPADSLYHGRAAPVDTVVAKQVHLWGTSKWTSDMVDSILAAGPNFAGHYTVVATHRGAEYQAQTIIDARTGKLLLTIATRLGADHRLNSRLLITNPLDSKGCYPDCESCRPTYFQWDGVKLDSIW
jgi:hypothetical protein